MTGELLQQNDKETTLDSLMEGFQLIDFDWRYLYVNDAVVKHSKFKKEELVGSTMMERYPGIEQTPLYEVLKICMKDRRPDFFENEFTYPDSSKGWFELRIQPVPEGLFILSIDITERKKLEEEKSVYIQDIEKMLFMTSHKVRQAIANIKGISSLLNSSKTTKKELVQITNYMKQSIDSLDSFTTELTSFINGLHDRLKS